MKRQKTVLITGCSSGFGRLMVDAFLAEGWTVVATLRNLAKRSADFDKAALADRRLLLQELDVTCAEDRIRIRDWVAKELGGRLDCLVNNAGYGVFGALEDLSEETLRKQFEVNFFGVALFTQALLPSLRNAKGKVINLSSVAGIHGMPLTSLYCASKFALEGLSESLSHELAPHGVQVSLVEPGAFRTRFGANVAWSDRCEDPNSPYAIQTANYKALLGKMMSGRGTPPDPVIRAILKLAHATRMPLRVRCGKDAQALGVLLRFMPGAWFHRLVGFVYGKVFNKGFVVAGSET